MRNLNEQKQTLLSKYKLGIISNEDRHLLEKLALDDPFLFEAMEGYSKHKENGDSPTSFFKPKSKNGLSLGLAVAASLLVVFSAIGIYSSQFLGSSTVLADAQKTAPKSKTKTKQRQPMEKKMAPNSEILNNETDSKNFENGKESYDQMNTVENTPSVKNVEVVNDAQVLPSPQIGDRIQIAQGPTATTGASDESGSPGLQVPERASGDQKAKSPARATHSAPGLQDSGAVADNYDLMQGTEEKEDASISLESDRVQKNNQPKKDEKVALMEETVMSSPAVQIENQKNRVWNNTDSFAMRLNEIFKSDSTIIYTQPKIEEITFNLDGDGNITNLKIDRNVESISKPLSDLSILKAYLKGIILKELEGVDDKIFGKEYNFSLAQ